VNVAFTLINYSFLLDTQTKSDIVLMDCRDRMKGEIDKELMNTFLFNPISQNLNIEFAYLNIEVRREMLIEDTLNSLLRENLNFRKPLKVKFIGEPGVDEGGV
jgi:ubiquitin-protein ligase E3 A